jgi:hypothetical protein
VGFVANKRQVKRGIRRLQHLKTWQLVVLLVLAGFIAATFLRLNNVGMANRRDAAIKADATGDQVAIKSRLFDLQRYVTSHMNADMGSIYLENQYKRDSQQVLDAASGITNPNGNIFRKAQDTCAPKFTHYTQAYLQCVVDYLDQYTPAGTPTSTVKLPRADAYRFSYVSPLWSPDFAGFSTLICLFILVMIFARLIGLIVLKFILKMSNR